MFVGGRVRIIVGTTCTAALCTVSVGTGWPCPTSGQLHIVHVLNVIPLHNVIIIIIPIYVHVSVAHKPII